LARYVGEMTMGKDENKRQKQVMKKRRRDKAHKKWLAAAAAAKTTTVERTELNIAKETQYIIQRAQQHEGRVVSIGVFVLFSTDTGDAWLLDRDDRLARCLCRDGALQPFKIIDTPRQFGVEWTHEFAIEDALFHVVDKLGNSRSILGYPTSQIQVALSSVNR
jgi:hypothetical protein